MGKDGTRDEVITKHMEWLATQPELIEKIREIRENQGYRKKMIELGKQRAKMFSWKKCAEETMEAYESCLSLRQNK